MNLSFLTSTPRPPPRVKSWYNPHHVLLLQLLNIFAYVILIILVLVATAGGVFPFSPTSLLSHFPTSLSPSPFSLSLWAILLLLAGFYVIYQALPRQRFNPLLFQETHVLFSLSCVFLATWAVLEGYGRQWESVAAAGVLEGLLILIYFRINRIKNHPALPLHTRLPLEDDSSPAAPPPPPSPASPFPPSSPFPSSSSSSSRKPPAIPLVALPSSTSSSTSSPSTNGEEEASPSQSSVPAVYHNAFDYIIIFVLFSLLLSWTSFSLSLTLAQALRYQGGWDGRPWDESGWAALILALLGLVAMVMEIFRRDAAFGLAMAWACLGVTAAQRERGDRTMVVTSSVLAGVLIGGALVVLGIKYRRFQERNRPEL